jgi:hypothetical protein
MVDRDDCHGRVALSNVDVHGGFREDGVDVVDGKGIVRVGRARRSRNMREAVSLCVLLGW